MGDAVAHTLAAGLVVEPEHREAGGLQHIEQVLVLVVARLEGALAQAGKHAGHRRQCVGAARLHIAPAQHFARRQFRRGVACIAVQREVVGARRFADDDHEHGRPRLPGVAGAQRRPGRDRHQLAAARDQRLERHHAGRVQAGDRIHHVAQVDVVAHQRRQFALQQQRSASSQRHGTEQQQPVAPQLRPQAHRRNTHAREPQRRQRRHPDHIEGQAPAEQVTRLVRIGLQHVGDHRGVHHHAIAQHVVLDHRGQQHDAEPQRLHPARPGRERQACQRTGEHQDRHRRDLRQIDAGGAADAREFEPQRPVGHDREVGAEPQHHAARRTLLVQDGIDARQPGRRRGSRARRR